MTSVTPSRTVKHCFKPQEITEIKLKNKSNPSFGNKMNAIQISHIKEYIKRKKNVRDAIKDAKNSSDTFHFVEEYLELLNLLDDYLKN